MMTTANREPWQEGAFEHEGLWWRPEADATSSVEEVIAARTMFIELHQDSHWNPGVLEDRAGDVEAAKAVMGQWKRAEPGHRKLTLRQIRAQWARDKRASEASLAADVKRWELAQKHYDRDREAARLASLELESRLDFEVEELARMRSGAMYPSMDDSRRASHIAKLEESIDTLRTEVGRLAPIVGDPEQVVDVNGHLPGDRRESLLYTFALRRQKEVGELRAEVPGLAAALGDAPTRSERTAARQELKKTEDLLHRLLSIPRLGSSDMCSECPTPASWHGWSTPPSDGPCPAWPRWAARVNSALEMLRASKPQREQEQPPAAAPKPLAVVPSGLPISEIIARLAELQARYPDAEVRRGRANRWEIWPATAVDPPGRRIDPDG